MSDTIFTRIKSKHDTTANWDNAVGFIPLPGEIIIYDDYQTKTWTEMEYGQLVTKTKLIPGIKIGTGNAYVQDLGFVDEDLRDMLLAHINNEELHTTLSEKLFWNNKLNTDDSYDIAHGELQDETLILNRN
jgi:hypothetical protein